MAVTQIIKLDLNNHKADDIIIRVGESYTRKIVFIPGTYDGDEFKPIEFYGREEGPRALFRQVKPDRTFVMKDLTVVFEEPDTGFYSFELVPDEYMSQVAGIGYYDLRINDSDTEEEFLYTVQGRVLIDDDMITDSMIESEAASNGYVFPDDFLTRGEFDPDDYATKQYVDDAIAEIPDPSANYSTTERVVGSWIDGSDVYEKTITYAGGSYGDITIPHGISDIKTLVAFNASCRDSYGGGKTRYIIPRLSNDGNHIYLNGVGESSININVPIVFSNRIIDYVIVMRYTKNS